MYERFRSFSVRGNLSEEICQVIACVKIRMVFPIGKFVRVNLRSVSISGNVGFPIGEHTFSSSVSEFLGIGIPCGGILPRYRKTLKP